MTPSKIFPAAAIISLTSVFCSCQKVIHIDLNSSSPQYVIEGNVTNLGGIDSVKISRSVNFDQDNTFPAVSGAVVTITDSNAGVTDTLREQMAGMYITTTLPGIPGHTYKLYIKADNRIFTAASTMPAPVTLDSLYTEVAGAFRKNISLVPVYTDPAMKGNYYQV